MHPDLVLHSRRRGRVTAFCLAQVAAEAFHQALRVQFFLHALQKLCILLLACSLLALELVQ